MTRRRNLKIWRFLNVSHEQESLLILQIYWLIFILPRLSHSKLLFGKTYNFEDILLFPWIFIFSLIESV